MEHSLYSMKLGLKTEIKLDAIVRKVPESKVPW